MRFTTFLIKHASEIMVGVVGIVVFFTAGATMTMPGWTGLTMSLGFVTGVDGPWQHTADLNAIGMVGAWLTVMAGWVIIPMIVALLLGQGEKTAQAAKDAEYLAFMYATRRGWRGEKRDKFVKRLLDRESELLQQ